MRAIYSHKEVTNYNTDKFKKLLLRNNFIDTC